jgi:hypothetical protein
MEEMSCKTLSNHDFFLPIAECDEDLESVHEGMDGMVGSTTTNRRRARQILKTPEKKVCFKIIGEWLSSPMHKAC